jgi:hypothetical protein
MRKFRREDSTMRLVAAFAFALTLSCLGVAPAHADKRVALVIGNADYQKADKLANPVTDARGMRDALSKLGFEIVYGENLGKQALERTIGRFANAAQDSDVALVFFAGHGATFGDVPYVVPVDAQFTSLGEMPYELVPVETLIGELRRAKGLRIAILDACRDNAAERELKRATTRGGEITRGLVRVRNPEGLILAYATQYLSTAADGNSQGNSPFTAALLSQINTPGLDVKDLFFNVGREVIEATQGRQRPEISVSFYDRYALAGTEPASPAARPVATPAPIVPPPTPGPARDLATEEAARAWSGVKDTTSPAMLEAFIARYGDSLYAPFARARLTELRKSQVAVAPAVVPPPVAPAPVQPIALPRASRPRAAGENCAATNRPAGIDTYCASSVRSPEYGNSYGVRNLFSTDEASAWVEGVVGQGVGEWIVVEFDGLRSVKHITIHNGYQKNADIFGKNSRVRRVRVIFSQGETRTVPLEDRRGAQTISLDRPIKAYWVQLVIEDVFPGARYTDTAISKLSISSERAQ